MIDSRLQNNDKAQTYIGRFAPSPTGPVHFGTLVAAVGSYLQAKTNRGKWLIRIDDVDITRKIEGADTDILNTLAGFGFEWHDHIVYQSEHNQHYQQALAALNEQSLVFPCTCSRKKLAETENRIYPGTCRHRVFEENKPHALRLRANNITLGFNDRVMGEQWQNIKNQCGDFIIKRRDQLFAYQLAVVVDDALQGITEVVRGADLLDSTARQIYLQQLLGYKTPAYCHLPLVIDTAGNKISKSRDAGRIDLHNKETQLCQALLFLGQILPDALHTTSINTIWQWAIENWDTSRIPTGNRSRP